MPAEGKGDPLQRNKLALQKSEERFRLVVESAPNAIVMVGPTGLIEMVNAQTERVFGYTRVELLGKPIEILVPERYRPHHPGLRKSFFADPVSRPMGAGRDLYGLRKDGSEFPVEIGLNPIETDEGTMVLSAIVDISARKRLEERFRLVVELAPNAIVMIGPTGLIEMVNAQTERVFGYTRVELLGKPIEMLVPERYRPNHPGLRKSFFADPVSRPMGAGRDLYGLRKDGSEFPVEIGLNPIETDEGTMVLSAIVDISARKRLEERFRLVVESAPNAMVMIGPTGLIEMVNAQTERVFGYTRVELLGQTNRGAGAGALIAPIIRDCGSRFLQTQYRGRWERDVTSIGLSKDGSEFPVEIGLNPIETDEGTMVLSAIVDISARKRTGGAVPPRGGIGAERDGDDRTRRPHRDGQCPDRAGVRLYACRTARHSRSRCWCRSVSAANHPGLRRSRSLQHPSIAADGSRTRSLSG